MSMEEELKKIERLLVIICINIGLDPTTGEKVNGLFTSQKEMGQRIGKLEQELKHNVTWPGFFKAIITCAGVIGALVTILTILLGGAK